MDGGLRKLLREKLPQVHWQAIETGGVGLGVPDVNGCYRGAEFWVELKQTDGWAVTLRPHQIGWLLHRARAGGRVFVLVRRAREELWLCRGSCARELKSSGLKGVLPAAVLEVWGGGPQKWGWEALLAHLAGSEARP